MSLKTLSVSHTLDSSPEGRAFGSAEKFTVLPRPLPLGEVALRKQ